MTWKRNGLSEKASVTDVLHPRRMGTSGGWVHPADEAGKHRPAGKGRPYIRQSSQRSLQQQFVEEGSVKDKSRP